MYILIPDNSELYLCNQNISKMHHILFVHCLTDSLLSISKQHQAHCPKPAITEEVDVIGISIAEWGRCIARLCKYYTPARSTHGVLLRKLSFKTLPPNLQPYLM
jgi:hypothetical protein